MKRFGFVLAILLFSYFSLNCQINTEALRRSFKNDTILHSINAELGLAKGNSDYIGILTGYRGDLYIGRFYTFLSLNLEYREASSKKIINKGFAHLRTMYEFDENISAEVFLQREYNEFILLKDRKLFGAGGRFSYLDSLFNGKYELSCGVGVMLENELLKSDFPTNNNHLRTTNYISFKWDINKLMNFMGVMYYQAELGDFDNYKILSEINLGFIINTNLTFYTAVKYRYNNTPPPEVKNFDLSITNGIKISL